MTRLLRQSLTGLLDLIQFAIVVHMKTNNAINLSAANVNYTIRYDTRCYFNVRSKADISRLNLPHEDDKLKSKSRCVKSNSKSLGNHV